MKRALRNKIEIYQPNDIDWMNFKLTRDNPYTLHHILEKRNGGDNSPDNLAILTKIAHKLLNVLDKVCPDAYDDLQDVFIKINGSGEPPTDEIINEVDDILYKVFFTNEYKFTEEVDLSRFIPYYTEGRKQLKKCLK
jgi:hypothetical protein